MHVRAESACTALLLLLSHLPHWQTGFLLQNSIKQYCPLSLTLCKRLMATTGLLTMIRYIHQKHATLCLES